MFSKLPFFFFPFILLFSTNSFAVSGCYDGVKNCDFTNFGSTRTSSSSSGGKVKINPAAVPTEDGFGVESITFKSETDFGLVRGNGRIGAAISPTNSEETFFGPPGFALEQDLFERKYFMKKYPSQKISFATAFNLIKKNGTGIKNYSLKLGVMGRYNKLTHAASPGGGLSGTLGPFSFGASVYKDETLLDEEDSDFDGIRPLYQYEVRTHSIGVFLSSLMLDYSHLDVVTDDVAKVDLITASLYLKKFIFTASKRVENSALPTYDYETKSIVYKQIKEEYFGGIQYNLTKFLMVGALYNYYLLREYSITATLFF